MYGKLSPCKSRKSTTLTLTEIQLKVDKELKIKI